MRDNASHNQGIDIQPLDKEASTHTGSLEFRDTAGCSTDPPTHTGHDLALYTMRGIQKQRLARTATTSVRLHQT